MRISLRYRKDRQETIIAMIDQPAPENMVQVTSWTPTCQEPVTGPSPIVEILAYSEPVSMAKYPGGAAALQRDLDLPSRPDNRRDWGDSTEDRAVEEWREDFK